MVSCVRVSHFTVRSSNVIWKMKLIGGLEIVQTKSLFVLSFTFN